MSDEKLKLSNTTSFFINAIGIVIIFAVLKELQSIFTPLLIAYFLFFIFSPLNDILSKYKIPPAVLVLLDLLIIIFLFGGIISILIDSFGRFAAQLPQYEVKLNNIVSSTAISFGIKDPRFTSFNIARFLSALDIGLIAGSLFSSTFSFLGTLILVTFFFIFVASGHQNFVNALKKRYPGGNGKSVDENSVSENPTQKTFREITEQIQKYVFTKFLTSILSGLTVGIVLWLFHVDFVIIWAACAFILNFIPVVGSIIAVLLPSLMSLVQYESIAYMLLITGIIIIIQNLIGNFIEPKIFGNKLGLNPLVILLSLLLWGYVWGIVGILLSIPLTAIVKIIISRSESPNLKLLNDFMSN